MVSVEERNRAERAQLAKPLIKVEQLSLYRGIYALDEVRNKGPPIYLIAPDFARATEMLRLIAVEASHHQAAPNNPRSLDIEFVGENVYIDTKTADARMCVRRS